MNFKDFALAPELIETLTKIGFDTPTPIQAQTIEPALNNKDILGIAQTGTGKTGAFLLPLITAMHGSRAKARMPRCVILEPTRELASQVQDACQQFCENLKLESTLLIGGVSARAQEDKINKGVDILIATPGRFLDHFERGKLLLNDIQHLVIDEADRMLDMGFIPDIEKICEITPFTKQSMLFSATMPEDIAKIADKFMFSPIRVEVSRPATAGENIAQHKIFVGKKQKPALLRAILTHSKHNTDNTIIFCNSKKEVDNISKMLNKHDLKAKPMHGDIVQSIRTEVLEQFKSQELKILIASDVAARGIDVPHIARVVNYDIPYNADDYVHRIGRTGRGGKSGEAFCFVDPENEKDIKYLSSIEKLIGSQITEASFDAFGFDVEPEVVQPKNKPSKRNTPNKTHKNKKNNSKGDHADIQTLATDPNSFQECDEIPAFLLTPLPKYSKMA